MYSKDDAFKRSNKNLFFFLRQNGREYYNFLRSLQLFKHSLVAK